MGELYIGLGPGGKKEHIEDVADILERAGLKFVKEEDIMHRIWAKFMLNVGANQTAMVYKTTYGALIKLAEKHGIPVPVNRYLNKRAREIEAEYIR